MPAKRKRAAKTSTKKSAARAKDYSFTAFVDDPMIATALIVFALIALVLSILEFSSAITK